MKTYVTIYIGVILLLIELAPVIGQSDFEKISPFDEFWISINRTHVHNDETEDLFGFGLAIYKNFRKDKTINPYIGIKFDRTNQFLASYTEAHNTYYYDVTYSVNSISIPVILRFNFGNKYRFQPELGLMGTPIVRSRWNGVQQLTYPDTGKVEESNVDFRGDEPMNYYSTFGFGISFPVSGQSLYLGVSYIYGLRNTVLRYRYFTLNMGATF